METKTQHTPTPWGIEETTQTLYVGPLRKDGSGKIADIVTMAPIYAVKAEAAARHRANMDLIVRACNNHEALIAALKRISEVSTNGLNPGGSVYTALNLAKEAAQSALHKIA